MAWGMLGWLCSGPRWGSAGRDGLLLIGLKGAGRCWSLGQAEKEVGSWSAWLGPAGFGLDRD